MLNRAEILNTLKEQKSFLQEKFHVKEIGLFGSYARNEATPSSDIDFVVEFLFSQNYIETKESLRYYLSNLFNKKIDLANPRSLKPHFKKRILSQTIYA
ncbi:MAG: nucleotidyltransferase family protein [Arachidicoccus sp.]|nr:nucleotidyltransferase family protein [Arachidicoccus sp.]